MARLKRVPKFKTEDEERDIPYQALLKQFLIERVDREWRQHRAA